jgi:hypothetical protein
MNRQELTALYLDEVRRQEARATDLTSADARSGVLKWLPPERFLSRPLFLGRSERDQVQVDLEHLRSALMRLPDLLFAGDRAAFARAVGMTDVQVAAITRCPRTPLTRQARADLYTDASGFRLLELNLGSALGGMENADICRMLLNQPVLGEFAAAHKLGYVDTLREQVNNLLAETGTPPGSFPMVALTDWPSSYESMEPHMRQFAARQRELGLDTHVCHIGELEVRDGRVWLRDMPVDIISRMFLIEDLLEHPGAPALMDPILAAAARGEVKIFTPMDTELFASKGALAMLSDEQNRHLLGADELAAIDRILPWTRTVRSGPVTLEDGRGVELLSYAIEAQAELALKPTLLHGGDGVLLGWHDDTTPELWRERLTAAVDGPYVLQRRIRPVPELFPSDNGEPVPWIVACGVFSVVSGYGGVFARATTVESNNGVVNIDTGASIGCCLHPMAA